MGATDLQHLDSMEKYARIAAGDAELYLRLPRLNSTRPFMTWDHAAGTALVEAAGGVVSDVDGSPLDFSHGRTLANQGIIVSNGHIHARVIQAVQKVLAEG
jgi:3'(2'), 5'-bisphosphate nucleotidase